MAFSYIISKALSFKLKKSKRSSRLATNTIPTNSVKINVNSMSYVELENQQLIKKVLYKAKDIHNMFFCNNK